MRIHTADLSNETISDEMTLLSKDQFIYRTIKQSPNVLELAKINTPGDLFHQSFLDYLKFAWSKHLGVVFSPDILWYTLLSEINNIVRHNPERHRHLFSRSKDIQYISISALDDLAGLIQALKDKVPINLDLFLPSFSTSDDYSILAHRAAFLDTVSPYYAYFTYTCGIPFVDVLGTQEDYLKISDNWKDLTAKFDIFPDYFKKVQDILNSLLTERDNPKIWKNIFCLENFRPCPGVDLIVNRGWFTDLFCKEIWDEGGYPIHNSLVHYSCNDSPHILIAGIFSSTLEDNLLTPHFGNVLFANHGKKAEKDISVYMR